MEREQVLDIPWRTITKVFIAIFIFYVIYLARSIVLWFFFALIISVLLEPAINFLRKLYIPKIIAIVLVYLFILGALGLFIYLTAPVFVFEIKQFAKYLPGYFEQVSPFLRQFGIITADNFNDFVKSLTGGLEASSESIITAIMTFFGGISSAAFILTIAFFLSLEEKGTERFLVLLTPKKYEQTIANLFEKVQEKVSGWFGARLLACLFVGVASYIVFYIFNVKYAFILALISAILNFVPYIGPWITSILLVVFIIVSTGSWLLVLYVLIAITIVQEIENKLVTPLLMERMIDLPPALVIVALLVGAEVFGFLGMVFAVPVFGIIYEFLKEFLEKRREQQD